MCGADDVIIGLSRFIVGVLWQERLESMEAFGLGASLARRTFIFAIAFEAKWSHACARVYWLGHVPKFSCKLMGALGVLGQSECGIHVQQGIHTSW